MKKRRIWSEIKKEFKSREIIVITGPRQVGKTTTLHWILDTIDSDNSLYFDLENVKDRELFEAKDYDSLINEFENRGLKTDNKMYIAIDEIQLARNLPSVVKYLHDNYSIKFFLTGSSSFYIKNRFSESMAGRKRIFEMLPLCFQEFLDFQGVNYTIPQKIDLTQTFQSTAFESLLSYYQEYIDFGGLPRVVLTNSRGKKRRILEEIFSSYINIDVQTLADFRSSRNLRTVIKLLARRIGSRMNVNELSKIVGLSRKTVVNLIEFLETTYIIRTIPAYSKSPDVQTRLQRKPYFVDSGIASINADLSGGAKFENSVCHQLSFYGDLSYYNTRDGEIDFILNKTTAFEVKETPTDTDRKSLERRSKKIGLEKSKLIGKEKTANFDNYLWAGYIY